MSQYEAITGMTRMLNLRIHMIDRLNLNYHGLIVCGFNVLSAILETEGSEDAYYRDCQTGATVPIRPDCVYLLPGSRKIFAVRTPAVQTLTIHFELRLLNGPDVFSEETPIRVCEDKEYLRRLTAIFADENPIRAAAALEGALLEFLAPAIPPDSLKKALVLPRYETLFRYAEKNCSAALRVGDLAAVMRLRDDQFSRQFRHDLGMTPKAFLDGLLLRRILGEMNLRKPELKLLANQFRFPNEYALSRFFKRVTGFSPREYLRRRPENTQEDR